MKIIFGMYISSNIASSFHLELLLLSVKISFTQTIPPLPLCLSSNHSEPGYDICLSNNTKNMTLCL